MRTLLVLVLLTIGCQATAPYPEQQCPLSRPLSSELWDPFGPNPHRYCFNADSSVIVRPPLTMQYPPTTTEYTTAADYAMGQAQIWLLTQPDVEVRNDNDCAFGAAHNVVITMAPGNGNTWHTGLVEITYDKLAGPNMIEIQRVPAENSTLHIAWSLSHIKRMLPPLPRNTL